jgi:enoyl-CoA hydratase
VPEQLGYSVKGNVATVTIDRPEKRNAMTTAMMEQLFAQVEAAGSDDDVKVVVLRSEGPVFCSGFDVNDPKNSGVAHRTRREDLHSLGDKIDWPRNLLLARKPLVARVHGDAMGLGMHLVLACDFAVAARSAGFGVPEERFGGVGASWAYPFLIRAIGLKRATDWVMTGRRFTADETAALGLVTRVVDDSALDDMVDGLAAALCTLSRDSIALNRAARRVAMEDTGYLSSYGMHAMNTMSQLVVREPDEFDFVAVSEARGVKAAIAERNELVAGDWWGW